MRYFYITAHGLYMDMHGRFVEDMSKAWVTSDSSVALAMADEHCAAVGIL